MNPPAVILVRPREEGNVGAAARAMANMGLERLILVEPAPELGGTARGFGVGGWSVLDGAARAPSLSAAVAPFHRVVGTASRRQRNLRRQRVVTPRRLPGILAADPPGTAAALVFGPEDNGLTRKELELCHPVVAVPCSREHPTLNLAQAVLVLAYELFVATTDGETGPRPTPRPAAEREALASAGELRALRRQAANLLLAIGLDDPPIRAGLLRDLRRLLSRAEPSVREIRVLRRLVNRAANALGRGAFTDEG